VKSLPVVSRHPALRWLVPLFVGCVAGAGIVVVAVDGGGGDTLPDTTAAALVSAVRHDADEGFSGTVVSQISLGLPAIPALPGWSPTNSEASFTTLLAGSHTMQVWYAGRTRQRVALLGVGGETDLFRNGRTVWQWNSASGVARHIELSATSDGAFGRHLPEALTPAALADGALAALDGDTGVELADEVTVADRTAYDLVLTPRDPATKIGSVHVAVDGATNVPLGVQVYPKGSDSAAIDVAFTSIRFGTPAERNFTFVPPSGATVSDAGRAYPVQNPVAAIPTVSGDGWTTVRRLAGRAPVVSTGNHPDAFASLTAVSGHWGKGRLVQSDLLSLLVTRDGRVFAGAVRPDRLYAAAGRR
jgi:outer membrane lipoprotein-sorting protein